MALGGILAIVAAVCAVGADAVSTPGFSAVWPFGQHSFLAADGDGAEKQYVAKACAAAGSPGPADAKVLIATPIKNGGGVIDQYARTLLTLTYPKELMTVALLVSDSSDDTMQKARMLKSGLLKNFSDVKVLQEDFHYGTPVDRHAASVQSTRRSVLAKSRNSLLERALTNDTYGVLWFDVDIYQVPPTLVEDMIKVGRPIVAPHVCIGTTDHTYDRNSWVELEPDAASHPGDDANRVDIEAVDPVPPGHRLYLDDLRERLVSTGVNDPSYGVEIDGVGTALLWVDAKVHRQGIMFPDTPYKHRLESEGFGLQAEDHGYKPCGLPLYYVKHVDEWYESEPIKRTLFYWKKVVTSRFREVFSLVL